MRHLEDRVVVVTGAGSGIGRSLASAFGREGCRVVVADIEQATLQGVLDELAADGVEGMAVVTDVADPRSVEALAARALDRFGEVHIVCNSAGVSARRAVTDMALDDWRWVIGVDLWGVIHTIHSFLPVLLRQDEAHIVNISSMAGLLPFVLGAPYNAAKAGVVAISETLYQEMELLGSGVGVTVVCPGGVRTRFLDSERNRPASLEPRVRNQLAPSSAFADINASARQLIESEGMDPDDVATLVVEAVRSGTFYVLSHRDDYRHALEERTKDIVLGRPPSSVVVESPGRSPAHPEPRQGA
jgi:NAD(P)-dependent dehydrogenase (short-subunit alcohol dehydrogenase family)